MLLAGILLTLTFNAFSQQRGTPDYLLVKRGFGIFKLGEAINKYTKYFTINRYYDNDDSISIYKSIDPEHLPSEDNIKIKYMELRVNNGLIEGIDMFIDKKYKGALLKTLKVDYGQTKGKESAFWKTKDAKIILSYANGYKTTGMARVVFLQTDLNENRKGPGKMVTKYK